MLGGNPLVATMPGEDEGYWIANERLDRFLQTSRKPMPVSAVLALLDEEHMVELTSSCTSQGILPPQNSRT